MRDGMPLAVVNGIGKLGAIGLVEKLIENDIRVMAVGDYEQSYSMATKVELLNELPDDMVGIDYVFDFLGDINLWSKLKSGEARLAVVETNNANSMMVNYDLEKELGDVPNWRVIKIMGGVGKAMDVVNPGKDTEFLIKAMNLAVVNSNLILPNRNIPLRLIGEESIVDVVMKSMFLSSTSGKIYEIWGNKITAVELAKWMIDYAKMTRVKVMEVDTIQKFPDENFVEGEWSRLRWKPFDDVEKSIENTLQEMFAKADEFNRSIKKTKEQKIISTKEESVGKKQMDSEIQTPKVEKRFAVEVEEPVVFQEKKVEVEEKHEIKPFLKDRVSSRRERVGNFQLPVIKDETTNETQKYTEKKEESNISLIDGKNEKKNKIKINIKMPWKWLGWGVVVMLLLGVAVAGRWGYINYRIVKNILAIEDLVIKKKYSEAEEMVNKTVILVKKNQKSIDSGGWNRIVWGRHYQDLMKVAEQALKIEAGAIRLAQTAELMNGAIFGEKEMNWKSQLESTKLELDDLMSTMSLMEARMAGDWSWIPPRWRGNWASLKQKVSETGSVLAKISKSIDFLPEILGTDGKRKEFLVLLQNESEIRPSGGFIGSYGIISFEKGKLFNFEINDIYEADGQLKGHVEPPTPIKKYLGEAGWYMRDANWQADFGMAAKDLMWFLEKETGRKVDGVIGVDLAVARAILGVTGEIFIPDFKEKVNKNNLYEQAEFFAETKFFPGSKQKASFLGGVGRQLFEEFKNLSSDKRQKMILTMIDLLDKNELQIFLTNEKANKVVSEMGWSGSIYDGKCAIERCFADYLYIVEANLGVNKANYFLYRSIDETIDIGSKSISRIVKINYENTAKTNNWPGGDYKNYMRVYIPESANLAEVSISDIDASGIKTIISGENLDIATNKGKKEIGFLVVVPAGKKRLVELRYVDQVDIGQKNNFSYLNYVQRQPGFGDTGLVTLINLPSEWQVNQVEPAASLMGDKLLFNQKLDRDIKMGVEILK